MSIRSVVGLDINYSEINREERNYAAVLFAALCRPGNPERFLGYCGFDTAIGPDFGIYFEYAYLRDLWWQIQDEETKKQVIQENLSVTDIDQIMELPFFEVNEKFGVAGTPSKDQIQFPGKWAIVKYNSNFENNDDFEKICRFKWAFNIKPDIVIHLDKSKAICIEAKYESGEGAYPSTEKEKRIFRERGIGYVGQMNLQKYMMKDLLGFEAEFMFLVYKKEKSETHKVITWAEAFGCLDLGEMPEFATAMAKRISV